MGPKGGHGGEDRDAVIARFSDLYRERVPFEEDRAATGELALQLVPTIDSILEAHATGGDVGPGSHHEGVALVSLLGRRVAELDVTPAAAMVVVPSLFEALAEKLGALPGLSMVPYAGMFMEGYVAARQEVWDRQRQRELADLQAVRVLAPGVYVLFLAGDLEPETLGEAIDGVGRRLLRQGGKALVVDGGGLRQPSRERVVALLGADETARMLGVPCIFAEVDDAWWAEARATNLNMDLITAEPALRGALDRALAAVGLSLRPAPFWARSKG